MLNRFENLPDEIILRILANLSVDYLIAAALVSKQFNSLAWRCCINVS